MPAPDPDRIRTRAFGRATIDAIGRAAKNEGSLTPFDLPGTKYELSTLSDEGLSRMSTFLFDLARRSPMSSPAFEPLRIVIEALDTDITNELTRREKAEEGS